MASVDHVPLLTLVAHSPPTRLSQSGLTKFFSVSIQLTSAGGSCWTSIRTPSVQKQGGCSKNRMGAIKRDRRMPMLHNLGRRGNNSLSRRSGRLYSYDRHEMLEHPGQPI